MCFVGNRRWNCDCRYAVRFNTEYERGAQQLAGKLCEVCELGNCDPQGRISGKQKHTTVVAYIHVEVLSTPTELIFIRH